MMILCFLCFEDIFCSAILACTLAVGWILYTPAFDRINNCCYCRSFKLKLYLPILWNTDPLTLPEQKCGKSRQRILLFGSEHSRFPPFLSLSLSYICMRLVDNYRDHLLALALFPTENGHKTLEYCQNSWLTYILSYVIETWLATQ